MSLVCLFKTFKMKITPSILFILCIEHASLLEFNFRRLTPYNSPVHYAMLKDFYQDDVFDDSYILFAIHIEREMANLLAKSETKSAKDDVSFNLDIIKNLLNNYDNMQKLKEAIEKDLPQIKEVLEVNPEGFTCDQKFCDKFGDGHHAFGICTPYSCVCSMFGPEKLKCTNGLYYDPVFSGCEIPTGIKICGL